MGIVVVGVVVGAVVVVVTLLDAASFRSATSCRKRHFRIRNVASTSSQMTKTFGMALVSYLLLRSTFLQALGISD